MFVCLHSLFTSEVTHQVASYLETYARFVICYVLEVFLGVHFSVEAIDYISESEGNEWPCTCYEFKLYTQAHSGMLIT